MAINDADSPEATSGSSMSYVVAMEHLVEVVLQLSTARDLGTVMDIVKHAARHLSGADGATFVLRDGEHHGRVGLRAGKVAVAPIATELLRHQSVAGLVDAEQSVVG